MVDVIRRAIGMVGAIGAAISPFRPDPSEAASHTAWDFGFESIEGGPMPLSRWRGQAVLVVNTASFCGYTSQYSGLQALWEKYEPRGLVVVGVPSNDFRQEKGSNEAVKQFCETSYGVEFPLTTISTVTGRDAHPFYRWAAASSSPPRWNFHKYLIARDGRVAGSWGATTAPEAPVIVQAIEAGLAAPVPPAT